MEPYSTLTSTLIWIIVSAGHLDARGWSYSGDKGPSYWWKSYPLCGGSLQSPINVNTTRIRHSTYLTEIALSGYHTADPQQQYDVINLGHTVAVTMKSIKIHISKGGLPGKYILEQIHFHWGSDVTKGSEHTVDGIKYDAEMHLVHYDARYASVDDAVSQANGMAVIGVFMEAGNENNDDFDTILDVLQSVKHEGAAVGIPAFPVGALLPQDTSRYYRYRGSMTTPGCFETVMWTIFHQPVKLSGDQLALFRTLLDTSGPSGPINVINNYRPIQPENSRDVFTSGGVMVSMSWWLAVVVLPSLRMLELQHTLIRI